MEEKYDELENVSEVLKESTLGNPDVTFCENTTYFDFLLSNAKDEEEEAHIKKTINDFLEIYNSSEEKENEND